MRRTFTEVVEGLFKPINKFSIQHLRCVWRNGGARVGWTVRFQRHLRCAWAGF